MSGSHVPVFPRQGLTATTVALVVCVVTLVVQDSDNLRPGRWVELRPKASYPGTPAAYQFGAPEVSLDQPCLLARSGRPPLLFCVGYELLAGDRLYCTELDPGSGGTLQPVFQETAEILTPKAVLDKEGFAVLVWTEVQQGGARLRMSRERADAPGTFAPAVTLTDEGPAFHPSLCTHRGQPYLAWQAYRSREDSDRGQFELFVASLGETGIGPSVRMTEHTLSDWDPVLTSDGQRLWLVWTRFMGRDYEVFARSHDPTTGDNGPLHNISADSLSDDLHPSAAVDPSGRLWIAFDAIRDMVRGASSRDPIVPNELDGVSVKVLCLVEGEVQVPASQHGDHGEASHETEFTWTGGHPQLVCDPSGRMHLAMRYFDEEGDPGSRHSYPVLVQHHQGNGWSEATLLEGSEGEQQEVALGLEAGTLLAAWHADDREQSSANRLELPIEAGDARRLEASHIYLTGTTGDSVVGISRVDLSPTAPEPLELRPRGAGNLVTRPHPLTDPDSNPFVTGDQHYTVEHGEDRYQVYFGDLHRHSSVSRCLDGLERGPFDCYDFGRDIALYDFLSVTDHSGHVSPFQWWTLRKLVHLFDTPSFCTLPGFEWSSNRQGHQNVIFREPTAPMIVSPNHALGTGPEGLWKLLEPGQAITIPHHTSHTRMPFDWDEVDGQFLRLVEIFQSARGSYEFQGCFRESPTARVSGTYAHDGLSLGHVFGIIASSDHGNNSSYAAVLAEGPARAQIFDGLHARRTYGCTTKGMFIDLRVNGALMGSEITARGAVNIELHALGTRELVDVVLFRDGEPIWREGMPQPERVLTERVLLDFQWFKHGKDRPLSFLIRTQGGTFDTPPDLPRRQRRYELSPRSVMFHDEREGKGITSRRVGFSGPPDATLTVIVNSLQVRQSTLARLFEDSMQTREKTVSWSLRIVGDSREAVDPEHGLGSKEWRHQLTHRPRGLDRAWFMARAVQADGEIVWSSPIFVSWPGDEEDTSR